MAPKKPAQKMSLGDFLQDSSLGNWADELEDMPVAPSIGGRDKYESRGYSNDRRDTSFSRDQEDSRAPRPIVPLPTQPPYTAHIGNLSFDLTESEIENHFEGCKVISVRIMKDRVDNRPKGFGYVEFADLDSLKKALSLADGQLAGRSIRVSVAEPPKSGGFGGDDASAAGEWRSGKVLPPIESRNRMDNREPRMNRNFSNEGRPERREMNLPSIEAGVDKWERKGPLPPPQETNERRPRTGGYGSRSGSANFGAAPSRSPPAETAADTGEWRTAKPLPPTTRSDGNTPPPASPALGGSPVLQRRKLALLPRSEHPQEPAPTPLSPSDEVKPKSNPFGSARPVDTESALKKVEEKLAKEKEHIKEEKETSKNTTSANPPPTSPAGPRGDKSRPHPKQLLRRTSAKDTSVPATGAKTSEIDEVVAAKAEAQEEAINEEAGKSWRKVEPPVAATAPEEEPGWETVPTRTKKANGVGARH